MKMSGVRQALKQKKAEGPPLVRSVTASSTTQERLKVAEANRKMLEKLEKLAQELDSVRVLVNNVRIRAIDISNSLDTLVPGMEPTSRLVTPKLMAIPNSSLQTTKIIGQHRIDSSKKQKEPDTQHSASMSP